MAAPMNRAALYAGIETAIEMGVCPLSLRIRAVYSHHAARGRALRRFGAGATPAFRTARWAAVLPDLAAGAHSARRQGRSALDPDRRRHHYRRAARRASRPRRATRSALELRSL